MTFMKTLIVATTLAFAASCAPDVDEDMPFRGELVYTDTIQEIYRLDRRIEVVAVDPMSNNDEGCGYLTDRAYEAIETTVESLDPSKDYVADPEQCQTRELVYIDGFEHSPFECIWLCCHPDLLPIATVYLAVQETLANGDPPTINGEPYVALEPDQPCT
jgi:hypothetical protein